MAMPCLHPPNNSSAAEAIAGNEDLISEILLRVPAQPLITFKCVSKQWLSLISSPNFSHRHTLRNPTSTISGVFLQNKHQDPQSRFEFLSVGGDHRRSEAPFKSLDFTGETGGIKILESCNGLLLCCNFLPFGRFRSYYVYNPTTKRFFKIPHPPDVKKGVSIVNMTLAFEPSKSPHYKVICVSIVHMTSAFDPSKLPNYEVIFVGNKPLRYYTIEIYSSEKRCWSSCGKPFAAPFDMLFDNGVFWNGAIHWISPTGLTLFLDMERECFSTMPTVQGMENWGRRRFRWFGQCRGHLHFIHLNSPQATRFNVYEMERDYSRWFVKYEVDLDGIIAAFPEIVQNFMNPQNTKFYTFVILSVVQEENEESSLLLHILGKVLSYNFKDKTFKKVYDLEPNFVTTNGFLQFGWMDAYHYIKTLACV